MAVLWQSSVTDRGSVFADGESAELPAGLVVPLPRSAVGVAEAKEIGPMNN